MVTNKSLIIIVLLLLVVTIVNATDYPVTTGVDDWYSIHPAGGAYSYDYTSTLLIAEFNHGVTPEVDKVTVYDIDTSAIPDDDIISAATLYFYGHTYTATKGVTKEYIVWMYDGSNWQVIKTGTFVSAGWISEVLTPTEIGYVEVAGDTVFRVTIADPGAAKYRTFNMRAYEYGGSTAYLSVTHAPAPSGYCDGEYSGTGDWVINSNTYCNTIETIPVVGNIIGKKGTILAIHKGIEITGAK